MIGKPCKIEPIDLLQELMIGITVYIKAGEIKFTRNKDKSILLSERAAKELAIEAYTYKEFFHSAIALANLIDAKTAGQYVPDSTLGFAKDMFVTARDKCKRLNLNISNQDVERERI